MADASIYDVTEPDAPGYRAQVILTEVGGIILLAYRGEQPLRTVACKGRDDLLAWLDRHVGPGTGAEHAQGSLAELIEHVASHILLREHANERAQREYQIKQQFRRTCEAFEQAEQLLRALELNAFSHMPDGQQRDEVIDLVKAGHYNERTFAQFLKMTGAPEW